MHMVSYVSKCHRCTYIHYNIIFLMRRLPKYFYWINEIAVVTRELPLRRQPRACGKGARLWTRDVFAHANRQGSGRPTDHSTHLTEHSTVMQSVCPRVEEHHTSTWHYYVQLSVYKRTMDRSGYRAEHRQRGSSFSQQKGWVSFHGTVSKIRHKGETMPACGMT